MPSSALYAMKNLLTFVPLTIVSRFSQGHSNCEYSKCNHAEYVSRLNISNSNDKHTVQLPLICFTETEPSLAEYKVH